MILLLAIAAVVSAQPPNPSPRSSLALRLYGNLISNAAKYAEEAVCYGVDPEQARRTLMESIGSEQQRFRQELVALHGEAALQKVEMFITFGAECRADRGPPHYFREYLKTRIELQKLLPLRR